jgi:hypothetical protein
VTKSQTKKKYRRRQIAFNRQGKVVPSGKPSYPWPYRKVTPPVLVVDGRSESGGSPSRIDRDDRIPGGTTRSSILVGRAASPARNYLAKTTGRTAAPATSCPWPALGNQEALGAPISNCSRQSRAAMCGQCRIIRQSAVQRVAPFIVSMVAGPQFHARLMQWPIWPRELWT